MPSKNMHVHSLGGGMWRWEENMCVGVCWHARECVCERFCVSACVCMCVLVLEVTGKTFNEVL